MDIYRPENSLRVFLCHSSRDKGIVREVFARLKNIDWLDPWLDEEKLLPGQDWHVEIEKAVEVTDVVVVFLSTQSVSQDGYVQRELKLALDVADEKTEDAIFIIPFRLDDCPAPRRLRGWQYVDYFPEERKDWAYDRLYRSLLQRKIQLDNRNISPTEDIRHLNVIQLQNEKEPLPKTTKSEINSKSDFSDSKNLINSQNSKISSYNEHKSESDFLSSSETLFESDKNENSKQSKNKRRGNVSPLEKTLKEVSKKKKDNVVDVGKKNEAARTNVHKPDIKTDVSRIKKKALVLENECEIGDVKFIKIPLGKFLMGSDLINGAKPMRTVVIPYDYWISVYPIVNRQFNNFRKPKEKGLDLLTKSDHPVVNISWLDALSYVKWLDQKYRKELPQNYKIRLPSEVEWEKASRGIDGRLYPWGNKHGNYSNSNGLNSGTTPVGKYSPRGNSPFGIADMVGNVWEWTRSTWRFLEDEYTESESFFTFERIIKGGSFNDDYVLSTCSVRQYYPPTTFAENIGFRIVISIA